MTSMKQMFKGVRLSTENYDAMLLAWSSQNLHSDVTFEAGNSHFYMSELAKQSLIDNINWTIVDGGRDCL